MNMAYEGRERLEREREEAKRAGEWERYALVSEGLGYEVEQEVWQLIDMGKYNELKARQRANESDGFLEDDERNLSVSEREKCRRFNVLLNVQETRHVSLNPFEAGDEKKRRLEVIMKYAGGKLRGSDRINDSEKRRIQIGYVYADRVNAAGKFFKEHPFLRNTRLTIEDLA